MRPITVKSPISPANNTKQLFIDLRQEVHDLFYGSDLAPGFSFDVIIRRVDKTQRCSCWDYLKQEADRTCGECSGSGWLTYDIIRKSLKKKYIGKEETQEYGQIEFDSTLFFFEHNVALSEEDSIIEVETDDCGVIASPVRILKRHSIKDVEPLKGNNGRVEFYKIYCNKGE
jgi:hypothetical protein